MKDVIDVMVDLETLGVEDGAQVIQISAGAFHLHRIVQDMDDMIIFDKVMDLSTLGKYLTLEQGTLGFWLSSSENAQVLNNMLRVDNGVTEEIMVRKFHQWLSDMCSVYDEVRLWGNGIIFDNVKVEALFKKYGLTPPIAFYNHRDVRTIVELASDKVGVSVKAYRERFDEGIEKHNAIHDVLYQARYVTSAFRDLMA